MFKSSIVGSVVEFFEHTLGIESDMCIFCIFIIVLLAGFLVLMFFLLIHWMHVKLED